VLSFNFTARDVDDNVVPCTGAETNKFTFVLKGAIDDSITCSGDNFLVTFTPTVTGLTAYSALALR